MGGGGWAWRASSAGGGGGLRMGRMGLGVGGGGLLGFGHILGVSYIGHVNLQTSTTRVSMQWAQEQ